MLFASLLRAAPLALGQHATFSSGGVCVASSGVAGVESVWPVFFAALEDNLTRWWRALSWFLDRMNKAGIMKRSFDAPKKVFIVVSAMKTCCEARQNCLGKNARGSRLVQLSFEVL